MSSQGFSFPPPPPPPPTTQQQAAYPSASQYAPHQGHRGGRGGGGPRGRGRGYGIRGARGGPHYPSGGGRSPAVPAAGFSYAPVNYGGYPTQPQATSTPYMPSPQYPQSQSPSFQHAQNPRTYASSQPFSRPSAYNQLQPHDSAYNAPATIPSSASYSTPTAPTYSLAVPAHQHPSPSNPAMMGSPMQWSADMQGVAGSYRGAPQEHARGPWHSQSPGHPGLTGDRKPRPLNKRDHATAFSKPQTTAPRIPAPPPVPSFGNPLPSKPPPAADVTRKPKKRKRKHNQLGLTPKTEEHESSEEEDDMDEESKLARGDSGVAPLQFTYKGRTATLQSTTDIAAWIAERKKKFPTQARIDEKKKAAAEAKPARDAAKNKDKQKGSRARRPSGEHVDPADEAMRAQRKAEKLRRNLDREQKRFAKAEAEAEAARLKIEALQKEAGLNSGVEEQTQPVSQDGIIGDASPSHLVAETDGRAPNAPEPESAPVEGHNTLDPVQEGHLDQPVDVLDGADASDWTSSSTSSSSDSDSDSDEDSAPEEVSSRRNAPERVAPPPREGKKTVCRHFARTGRCNRGDLCKFAHEMPERGPKAKTAEKKGRKGLFQALVDRQKEDENRRAMEVICFLGQNGLLQPTDTSPQADGPT